ncbi:hypothetical protein DIPPA_32002 [Diplonema papillatum]|nr:hypothetical protein DIPPA_32002 [Diplonema papillatum]
MANRRKKRGRDGEDDETENEAPRACLPLDDSVEDDTTRPPMNGDEYLRRVRAEAKKCPAVMVAKNRDSILRESQRKAQRVAPPGRTLAEYLVRNAAWRRATQ